MLLTVNRITKFFGTEKVLVDASFRLDRRDKAALVGRNGAGKTTLINILTGELTHDGGSIQFAHGMRAGLLKQEQPVEAGLTVLQVAQQGKQQALAVRAQLDALEKQLASGDTDVLDEYAMLAEHFNSEESYSMENDIRSVLSRMGFAEGDFDKKVDVLSGGQRTRLALARVLLEEPDLMILDEPTNHLDIEATEWLEAWIRSYHGAVLIVSHDSAFLENTVDKVIEVRAGKTYVYDAGFAKYTELRVAEFERQAEVARLQSQQMDKLDEYVRRFMNSQRTAQARGRLKQLEKLQANKVEAPSQEKGMKARFGTTRRSGDIVLEAKNLKVGFGENVCIKTLDWTVGVGDRWGVIGSNGSGKSSLVKVMLGQIKPLAGERRIGSSVDIGYFSQDAVDLDPNKTPLQYMYESIGMLAPEARSLLGRFLFSGDDVMRPIKTFSGGEKNKLVLARLTASKPNLLILDEPTNHLDMDSRAALADVLADYEGTLILVSHDRYLLREVADQIMDIKGGVATQYPGGYADYVAWKRAQSDKQPAKKVKAVAATVEAQEPVLTPRELSKEIARLEKLIEKMESDIDAKEQAIAKLEQDLGQPPEGADLLELTGRYSAQRNELEGEIAAWEEAHNQLEALKALQG